MKRIWSLCALLALLCALTIPAMAAAGGETSSETSVQTLSEVEGADESEENRSKIRKIWAVAGLIGVTCFAGALGMAHAVAKAAENIVDDDGPCVHRNGHHLCADRGDPHHFCAVKRRKQQKKA